LAAYFFQLFHEAFSISITQVFNQNQVVSALLNGTLCDIHKAGFIGFAFFLKALGNIRWNGNRRSP